MPDQITEKLSDKEWRLASEELAKGELALTAKRAELADELDEWKERKKGFEASISAMSAKVGVLARQVDTRTRMVDAQGDLPDDGTIA